MLSNIIVLNKNYEYKLCKIKCHEYKLCKIKCIQIFFINTILIKILWTKMFSTEMFLGS